MKQVVMMALAACLMCGCEKAVFTEEDGNESHEVGGGGENDVKKFTFTLKGDFGSEWKPVTRGYLSADGKEMTDVWVLDYMDGELVQQLHQTAADADWGSPRMSLAYGAHHVYFVASRGTGAVIDTGSGTVTWEKPSDTFWKDYDVNVVSTSNGNRAVSLDRVATKMKLTVTDVVPAACASVAVTTGVWYDGLDYVKGSAKESVVKSRVVDVPEGYAGTAGLLSVSLFGISGAAEWQTDVTVEAADAAGCVLGSATMTGVPFKRNRLTEYSGPLFGAGGEMSLGLNDGWEAAMTGSW